MTPLTSGTHGPLHRPISKYRQGRFALARWSKNEFEHVRTGKTRVKASSVSRIAQACPYGPKYRTFFRFAPRSTWARGHSSPTVSARYG